MSSIATLESWRHMSLNQLSQIFGIARETVKARIDNARINISSDKNGHPLYDARLVYEAIRDYERLRNDTSDPDKLPSKERRDWYEGNLAKKKDLIAEGKLVEAETVHHWMAELIKPGVQLLETIPDILERDFNVDPIAITDIERRIDSLRALWAAEIDQICTNQLPE